MTDTAAQAFITKWEQNAQKESSAAKEHFADLCRLLDMPTPNYFGSGKEQQGDPRVAAIAEAARELVRLRDVWLGGGEPRLEVSVTEHGTTMMPHQTTTTPHEMTVTERETTSTHHGTTAMPHETTAMAASSDAGAIIEHVSTQASSPKPPAASLKDRTLTNLYNKRPDWLDFAHRRLDAAVFDAYGWPQGLSDDEILARLLALNLERAARQGQTLTVESEERADTGEDQ